jgi:hypothetical protein
LVFFPHALEILLHTVIESDFALLNEEDEASSHPNTVLPTLVEFLDHFDASLDVIVGCARKTELTRWRYLFSVVGNPKGLFEVRVTFLYLDCADSAFLFFRVAFRSSVSRRLDRIYWCSTTLNSWMKTARRLSDF